MRLKLQGKIITLVLTVVLAVFIAITGITMTLNRTESMKQAEELSISMSGEYANMIAKTLEKGMNTARTLAFALEGMIENGMPDRDLANAMLSSVIRRNPEFTGVWTCWEPGAFDGKDGEYAGRDLHDATGRFIPYWYRKDGKVYSEALVDYDKPGDGDYYLLAKNSGRETMMEPFTYDVGGRKTLMTTLTVPIKAGGKVVGTAGVDIGLEKINEITKKVHLYETGFGRLVSHTGIVAGHKDESRVGAPAGEIGEPGGDEMLRRLQAGDSWTDEAWSAVLKKNTFKSYSPVRVGDTAPWSFSTVILEEEIMASSNRILIITGLISTLGVLLIAASVWVIARRVVKPVKTVAVLAERARQGDLTITRDEFGIRSRDELGEMADSLAAMIEAQAETVAGIQALANTVSSTAENLAALSQEANASMEEVRSHLSEAAGLSESNAAAIEEGSAGVEEVAGGAQAMAKAAIDGSATGEAVAVSSAGLVNQMNSVVTDLGSVGEKAGKSIEMLNRLERAVNDISGFVSVIVSIADQTNLLALNAAIEAARAGEAGRGFAVVADEVRKLAEESARAAAEVSRLIQTLGESTRGSISVTAEAGEIMGAAIGRAREAGAGLQEGLGAIRRLVGAVTDIASAAEEQAASSEEMASAMDQLSKGTVQITDLIRNISDASEETSRAAEGVAAQAQDLSEKGGELLAQTARFKLGPAQEKRGLVPVNRKR